MPRATTTYEIAIASPNDVVQERLILVEAMQDWNSSHSRSAKIVLLPRRWELDAVPNADGHPQDWINEKLIDGADFLIAVFQARIGSRTRQSVSGTVEEIERFISTGKPVLIYFSNAPIARDHDPEQLKELNQFKASLKDRALYNEFSSDEDLRRRVQRALAQLINDSQEHSGLAAEQSHVIESLPADALELLLEASSDNYAGILCTRTHDGESVQTNGREFVEDRGVRLAARWKAALQVLENRGLVSRSDASGEVYELTHAGFQVADEEESKQPLKLEVTPSGLGADHSLAIVSTRRIRLLRLEFLTTQGIAVSEQMINEGGDHFLLKLDQAALTKLFNTPRSDWNPYDHSGPMKIILVISSAGKEYSTTIPAQLVNSLRGSTAYREVSRSSFRVTLQHHG